MSGISKFKRASTTNPRPAPALGKPPRQPSLSADPIVVAMEQAAADVPKLLTPKVVSEVLGLTERTLERWRITGEGPRYVKLSRSTVRYLADDVTAFVAANVRANTAH